MNKSLTKHKNNTKTLKVYSYDVLEGNTAYRQSRTIL